MDLSTVWVIWMPCFTSHYEFTHPFYSKFLGKSILCIEITCIFTIFSFVQRLCIKDCHLGNIFIPKGVQVHVPVYDIHMNPDLWPEPEKFKPERL